MRHFTANILYAVILLVVSPWGWAASPEIPISSDRVALPGHVLPALSMAQPVAAPSMALKRGEEPLTLTIVLRRSDPAGFEEYLRDVYDPQSPQYLKFLNPEEVSDQFGPSQADYDTVQAYFERQGFTVIEGSANRLTMTVAGTRPIAEKAMDVTISDYAFGERQFFANDTEPRFPANIARRVQAVVGLSNLARPQPVAIIKWLKEQPCKEAGDTAGYLKQQVLQNGYDACTQAVDKCSPKQGLTADEKNDVLKVCAKFIQPKPTSSQSIVLPSTANARPLAAVAWKNASGAGQKIGLIQFDTFVPSDVSDFLDFFGMPSTVFANLSQVHVNGGATLGPDQREVLLDIDTVLINAPDAQVVVYDAPFTGGGSFQSLFNRAINDGMTIISNSWAYCEDQTTLADVQSIDSILAAAAAAGVSVFNASGDSGSTCLNGSPNTIGVPAGSPHAIAVGGTSQITGPTAVYQSETWWNGLANTPPTGQGGFGVSRFFARPAYQDGFTSSSMRSIPDVVFNSDPAQGTIICQASAGGCPAPFFVGGTSMAAPAWAAATAILNQAQGRNLGNLNLSLYPLANTDAFHSASSMGSDFAHVGLGSANFNKLNLALMSSTAGAVSATESNMRIIGSTAPADGVSTAFVVVRLRDSVGNAVSGKTVTLTANPGSHAVISPASGVSTVDNGAVVFTLTNLSFEEITLTATDTSDSIALAQNGKIAFVPPPAASAGISASPTSVPPNGTSTSTITVTLKDALNRPSPLKEIRLSQGGGHSLITGPDPTVTDANGQIQFVATNGVSETVVYTAVNVTDGDLPVPGSATVDFTGTPTSCVVAPPAAANGFALTSFANGFAARNFFFGNVNWNGCPGASNPAFGTAGSVFVADFPDGVLFKMSIQGGLATNANQIANLGPTLGQPVFGKDGSLYLSRSVTTGGSSSGDIVQVDPANGSIIRTVVSGLTCPAGLSVDPLSGDLFFGNQCFGASLENASLYRVRNPSSTSPTLEVYATLPATPNGAISFAPDGTLYVVSGYLDPNAPVLRIGGTDTTPTITQTEVTSSYWVTVGEAQASGAAKSLIVLSGGTANPTLSLVDLTTSPVTSTPLINGGIGSGIIGPDGCLYVSASDTIYKLAPSSGGCGFAATNPAPALILSPATVSPNPTQGWLQTMTAQFVNLNVPADTPVFFDVSGANAQPKLGRTDASGKATINYTGTFTGNDTVIASATVGASDFTSNLARLTWAAGQHVTFLSLNTSPTGATVGVPVTLSAALVDISVNPTAAIAGATIQFSVGSQSCSAVTNANGVASCSVTLPAAGSFTLAANFAGGAQQQASAASQALFAAAPVTSSTCFTGAVTSGGQATACLTSALPTCQFINSAFVPVASVGVAPPAGIQIPYGLFQFTATGCGSAATLSITYPNPLPVNARYWKFGPTLGQPAHWYALPATINGNTLTVTLTDGGAGDSDLQVNGSISDPGGAGYAIAAGSVPIPTLDEWGLLLFMLLLAAMVSTAAASRRRIGRF